MSLDIFGADWGLRALAPRRSARKADEQGVLEQQAPISPVGISLEELEDVCRDLPKDSLRSNEDVTDPLKEVEGGFAFGWEDAALYGVIEQGVVTSLNVECFSDEPDRVEPLVEAMTRLAASHDLVFLDEDELVELGDQGLVVLHLLGVEVIDAAEERIVRDARWRSLAAQEASGHFAPRPAYHITHLLDEIGSVEEIDKEQRRLLRKIALCHLPTDEVARERLERFSYFQEFERALKGEEPSTTPIVVLMRCEKQCGWRSPE